MDKSAIEQIQKSVHIPDLIKHLDSKETDEPTIVVPEGYGVESLETYMELRLHYRLDLKTRSISDFIEYGKDFDQAGAACFVDAGSMSAKTIFDLGVVDAPRHQKHTATLTLEPTAAYRTLLRMNEKHYSQKDASNLIEDWHERMIIKNKKGESMSCQQAAAALRDISIEAARESNNKVHDFGESMSSMEKIEAKNQDNIPAEICFSCTPYLNLQEYAFKVRIQLITGGDKPMVGFRVSQLESVQEDIAEEFKEMLVKGFEKLKLVAYMGRV